MMKWILGKPERLHFRTFAWLLPMSEGKIAHSFEIASFLHQLESEERKSPPTLQHRPFARRLHRIQIPSEPDTLPILQLLRLFLLSCVCHVRSGISRGLMRHPDI